MGGLLGLGGGAAGSGFSGPSSVKLDNPVSPEQLSGAYSGVQGGMESQKALLAAIQAQNGLGNQSQVYNQLQGIAAGTGPNPAQAMLAQSTGANVANQAALMAGQRGAAGNAGMIARQAGQQGGALQQQAAGQAATLQANQSLNAINSAGGMANVQAGNQIGQTNANVQAQQAEQQALLNAQTAYNNSQVGMQGNINSANANLAQTQMQGQQGLIGGVLGGAGAGLKALFADGGMAEETPNTPAQAPSGAQSKFGQFLRAGGNQMADSSGSLAQMGGSSAGTKGLNQGASQFSEGLTSAIAGKPAGPAAPTIMAGEPYMPNAMMAARGGMTHDYRSGGGVNAKNPNEKAVKSGNSYANDKIPAVLSEGEVVIPRSVMQGKDPVNDSARFVQAVLAKKGMRK